MSKKQNHSHHLYHWSFALNQDNNENISITNDDDIDQICENIIKKYSLDYNLKEKLVSKIRNHINNVKKQELNLTEKEKESVNRWYLEGIKRKQKQEQKASQIKQWWEEKEQKEWTFSPKISSKTYNNFVRKKGKKNKQSLFSVFNKSNASIQRIIKSVNEWDECQQFRRQKANNIASPTNSQAMSGNNNYINNYHCKNKWWTSSLKFIDRDLKTELLNEIYIPSNKLNINWYSNDLGLHWNKTIDNKRNVLCYGAQDTYKDSYVEIYKNQLNNASSSSLSSGHGRGRLVHSWSMTSKRAKQLRESGRSVNRTNDNWYEIKESNENNKRLNDEGRLRHVSVHWRKSGFAKSSSNMKIKQNRSNNFDDFKRMSLRNSLWRGTSLKKKDFI